MTQSDVPVLYPTRIDMPLEIRLYVLTMLQQTLACTIVLRSYVKQACWNIKGADFFPLQALFATLATELDGYTDLVADRIAALGGVARGTAHMAVTASTLLEYPEDLVAGLAHVRALAERFAHYATGVRAAMTSAADVEDANTANLYTDISRGVETRLRGLDAYLHQ
jgi:starvation-inducible DNA-binding protein